MTENETKLIGKIAEDYNAVLNEAKSMGCKNIRALYNIPLNNMELIVKALEKQIPKKPIEKVMPYSEEVGFNSEWHCPCCDNYIGYFTEGMSEPEQMEYCNNCGQHIAKDWSDED